jgi:deoxycytidylate deaminase
MKNSSTLQRVWRLLGVPIGKSISVMAMERQWKAHAEARICRKIDVGATVAVVRVGANGEWANSKPCKNCAKCMQRMGVKRVYYSIGPDEYAVMILSR